MAANLATQIVANQIASNTPQLRGDLLAAIVLYLEFDESDPTADELSGRELLDRAQRRLRLEDLYHALGG